jgi:hypothetical protein
MNHDFKIVPDAESWPHALHEDILDCIEDAALHDSFIDVIGEARRFQAEYALPMFGCAPYDVFPDCDKELDLNCEPVFRDDYERDFKYVATVILVKYRDKGL